MRAWDFQTSGMSFQMRPARSALLVIAAALASITCAEDVGLAEAGTAGIGEVVFSYHPASWFEDGWTRFEISPDGGRALFGSSNGPRLVDIATGESSAAELPGMEQIFAAGFDADGGLRALGISAQGRGWHRTGATGVVVTDFPPGGVPRWSPDASRVAFLSNAGPPRLYIGVAGDLKEHDLGGPVTGHAWSADGQSVFALVRRADGSSSFLRVPLGDTGHITLREQLDAPGFNAIGVHPAGSLVYLALAGDGPPDDEARHRPEADRDLDVYSLDLETAELAAVVSTPGDDFFPQLADGWLYWTHNAFRDDVVVMDANGGQPRTVVANAQIPSWTHDGRGIAFTIGAWRIADWALNLDAAIVDVDNAATPSSGPRPIVTGYHEDFTPAFSPDGRWMVYHSHRSPTPGHAYAGPGSTDDLYLLPVGGSMDQELRLTDFGWEVGMADWSPDSRRLVFDSWERDGEEGVGTPWIVSIDPTNGTPRSVERLRLPLGVRSTLLSSWSPDGERIAFVERIDPQSQALWTVRVDGSDGRRLATFQSLTYGGVDWTPDGSGVVYSALADGRMQLFRVPADGGEAVRLTSTDTNLIHPQVSPDGRWVAATQTQRVKELRRIPVR